MRRFLLPLLIIIVLTSCTVVTTESYRSADTLGGPLRFRMGLGVQAGQGIGTQSDPDSLHNVAYSMPAVQGFLGLGILDNLDIYGSASVGFPLSTDFGAGVKFKFLDNLGLKGAVIPGFKYTNMDESVSSGDTFSYRIMGGEVPVVFTYSILNMILLTGGVHGGYYKMSYSRNGVENNYDFFTYGGIIMPEFKLGILRISPGVDIRGHYSSNTPIVFPTDTYNDVRKHIYPFISISLQF